MSSNKDSSHHGISGACWSVSVAKPLAPSFVDLLSESMNKTSSLTARMSLLERPRRKLAHFVAAGDYKDLYGAIGNLNKDRVSNLAVQTKQPIVVPDVRETQEWKDAKIDAEAAKNQDYINLLDSFRSEIAVPLFDSHHQITAVMNLHHADVNGLTWKSVVSMEDLTLGTAKAIENAIQYRIASQRPSWGDNLFLELTGLLTATKSAMDTGESVFDLTTKMAVELSHAEFAGLWLLDPATNELHLASTYSCSGKHTNQYVIFRTPENDGIRGHVLKTGTPYYSKDNNSDSLWYPCLVGVKSCYTLPLFYNDKLFSVLCVDSFRIDAFDKRLLETLDLLAKLIGPLVGSVTSRISNQVRVRSRKSLIDSVSQEELFRHAVEEVRMLVDAESATIFKLDERRPFLVLAATTGLAPGYDSNTTYEIGEGITGWVAENRVSLRLRDCGDKSELKRWDDKLLWIGKTREVASKQGFERPLLVIPIFDSNGNCSGVIRASGKVGDIEFREEDKIALQQFSKMLAVELSQVAESLPKLCENSKLEDHLRQILERAVDVCEANAGTISIKDRDHLICVAYVGTPIAVEQLSRPLSEHSVTTMCALWGQAQFVADLEEYWNGIYRACFPNIQSELAVPIIENGAVLGVLNLESTIKNHFTVEHELRAKKLAEFAARRLRFYSLEIPELLHQRQIDPIELALRQFRSELPELLEDHPGNWVAYYHGKRIGITATKTELYEMCLSQNIKRGEFLVRCIQPELDEIQMLPDYVDTLS